MLVGLYLRQLDHEQKRPELDEARSKIHRRGGAISLRLAEFVQCGLFAKSFSLIIGSETPDSDARLKLHDFLSNLSVYLRFIKSDDRPGPVSEEIKTILYSRKPAIYMMAAKGVSATRCADEARRTLSGSPPLNDYEELQMFAPEKSDFYLILRRKS